MTAKLRKFVTKASARLAGLLAVVIAVPALLTGCAGLLGGGPTIKVLAGSEVKDLEPILADMTRETGVTLEFEYIGTLDGTEALLSSGDKPWQATWFPSNRYLTLFPEGLNLVDKSESIMRSPVVLGLKSEVAQRLGWTADNQPTWQEVVDAISQGQLTYGMTSPISSNSGFTTLVQMTTALSGTGTVLATGDIAATTPQLQQFASGQQLASGSSGWLVDKFAQQPDAVDGIFNYESVLETVQVNGQPLSIVIPSDGVVTSDYPLTLLKGADEETAANYQKVVDYLLRDDVQQRIADDTHRRTTATPPSMDASVFELPFPNQLETVQTLLETWLSQVKKPSNMVFAIDTSGSMGDGSRMDDLRAALDVLSGSHGDGTSSALLRLQPRERITYLEFSSSVKSEFTVEIPADTAGYDAALREINSHVSSYSPYGGTSVYTTVATAYEDALANASGDTISSIVLFTDGESNEGMSARDFERWYEDFVAQHPEAREIPVFTVKFGDSNADELERLAELTGGRSFDAKSESLAAAFREIRGYL
ncbi:VWA domain-containing protein [Gulosibacter macacae]|uniref:VWA domain-containing protein n=1 Tax=Gulosibacter macacae TaxID=2488791 RepID=A0A3P3W0X3_9MICO|nr:VWA domain-containing protein [Gulosibacter macacae]RRJ88620.1 VWA domain-containing protein [Gulosibacter macacae]